ncbi:MAG: hypothetical protein ACOZAN_03830 [Patescibacteria group bacterium]
MVTNENYRADGHERGPSRLLSIKVGEGDSLPDIVGYVNEILRTHQQIGIHIILTMAVAPWSLHELFAIELNFLKRISVDYQLVPDFQNNSTLPQEIDWIPLTPEEIDHIKFFLKVFGHFVSSAILTLNTAKQDSSNEGEVIEAEMIEAEMSRLATQDSLSDRNLELLAVFIQVYLVCVCSFEAASEILHRIRTFNLQFSEMVISIKQWPKLLGRDF